MFKPLVAVLVVGGVLAVAGPALATDYCVSPNTSCSGANNLQDFQDALNHAAADSAPDRIFLGAATYTAKSAGGFVYNPMNTSWPVEIIGAGRDAATGTTVVGANGGNNTLSVFGGPDASVHDLRVLLPPHAAFGADGLWTNAVAKRVTVTEDPALQSNARVGVLLSPCGVVEDHSVIKLDKQSGSTGIVFDDGGQVVRDSDVYASVGIDAGYDGTIERARISGEAAGIAVDSGNAKIESTAIETTGYGSVGIVADVGGDATVNLDGITVVGPDPNSASGTGVSAYNAYAPAASVHVHLENTIIRGYPTALYAGGTSPGHATIEASYSDYNHATDMSVGTASITESNVSYVGSVGFADESFAPIAGSPLIDAGDPSTQQGLDVDGNPLVTDGDHDGVARRDIGAYEFPGPLPSSDDSPAPPSAGGDVAPASGGSSLVPTRDTTAPVLSRLRLSHRAFAVGRARTAIAARLARGTRLDYSLSEAAKVVVTIRRVGAKRASGRLTRAARSGANTLKFSGRIGAKALKAGRYRAVITATDTAGNRSAAHSVGFRVLQG
jgi:hypothetical protein